MIFTKYTTQFELNNTKIDFDEVINLLKSNKKETENANELFNTYYNSPPVGYLERKKSGIEETNEVKLKRKHKEVYVKYKQAKFPFITFNCTMYDNKTHVKDSMVDYSGYMILDYDELTSDEVIELRRFFKESPYVSLIFNSPSANGIKVLVKISKLERLKHDDAHFKEYFNFIKNYYESELKRATGKNYITDDSGCNYNRGCYIPYDPDYIYNSKAKSLVYTKKSAEIIKQQVKKQSNIQSDSEVTREEINLLVKYIDIIHDNKLAVADSYDNWIRIGFCIKRYIKNLAAGKELFNRVSMFSKGYKNVKECEEKYENLVNGTSNKEISIKFLDNLIKEKTTFQVVLDKEEKNVLKISGVYTLVDVHKLMKQDNFKIIVNEINQNMMISWDGQNEFNLTKSGDSGTAIIRKHFLLNYNIDISRKSDFNYLFYNYDIQYVNPPIEMMKEYSKKYTTGLTENFIRMCELIPTEETLDDKIKLMKHYLLSVVNNLTYVRGVGRKCDEILILRSEEGQFGKTEFIRNILFAPILNWKGQYMYKESGNFREANKDLMFQDLSSVLNYKPEISKELTRNSNGIKQYLSIETFTVRRAYRENEEEFVCRTSFIGDTNDQYYLPNDSNLRRFLVINLTGPLQFKVKKSGKWIENGNVNFEMIWAYLYNLHMSGITYNLVDIPDTFKNNTDQISTDYDDAIIRKVVRVSTTDFFTIDDLVIELKRNGLILKDTSHESIRIKLKNMGLIPQSRYNKDLKKSTRTYYPGKLNCLDVKEDEFSYINTGIRIQDFDDLFLDKVSLDELKNRLNDCISEQLFESAAKIRDEIVRRNLTND